MTSPGHSASGSRKPPSTWGCCGRSGWSACAARAGGGCTSSTPICSSPSTTGSRRSSASGRRASTAWPITSSKSKPGRSRMSRGTELAASDREIIATRVFDAPRELVYRMWTDRQHVARWWGPNGFTNTIHEMDVRPGGVWRFVMHGPDGRDYQNKIVYTEVVPPERLAYDHVSGPTFSAVVTFAEEGGKTRVTGRMVFES